MSHSGNIHTLLANNSDSICTRDREIYLLIGKPSPGLGVIPILRIPVNVAFRTVLLYIPQCVFVFPSVLLNISHCGW